MLTYADAGVVYSDLDPFKVKCQRRAALTSKNAERFGLVSLEWTRGESVHVMYEESSSSVLHKCRGHVEEGLGTKIKVTDAVYERTGVSHYAAVSQDTVAMIVNDMVTLGIFPTTVEMHLAVGDSDWLTDAMRIDHLIEGWGMACDMSRAVWAGGETPTLSGLPYPVLAGSAAGVTKHDKRRVSLINPDNIRDGDLILLLGSSGIHANGLSLARKIAERRDSFWQRQGNYFLPKRFPLKALPDGYLTTLDDGMTYGSSLLAPTHIYVPWVEDCFDAGVDFSYLVNITGHGYRKLMRARQPFTYVLEEMMPVHPVFDFIAKHGPVDEREMYGNFNMGAGFAAFVRPKDALTALRVAEEQGFAAKVCGYIQEGEKKVVLKPVNIEFAAGTLEVR